MKGERWSPHTCQGIPQLPAHAPTCRASSLPHTAQSHQHTHGPSCVCHGPHRAALSPPYPDSASKASPPSQQHTEEPTSRCPGPHGCFSPSAQPLPGPLGSPLVLGQAGGIAPWLPQPMSQPSPCALRALQGKVRDATNSATEPSAPCVSWVRIFKGADLSLQGPGSVLSAGLAHSRLSLTQKAALSHSCTRAAPCTRRLDLLGPGLQPPAPC